MRTNLSDMLIARRPRIWYLAVGGVETIHGAMGNLQTLQHRVQAERIQGAIIDFRKLDGYDPKQDWMGFLKGVDAYTPHGLPIAWLAHSRGSHAARQLAQAAQRAGALSQYCVNWEMALMTVGLPASVKDPLPSLIPRPKDSKPPDDVDDIFYLD